MYAHQTPRKVSMHPDSRTVAMEVGIRLGVDFVSLSFVSFYTLLTDLKGRWYCHHDDIEGFKLRGTDSWLIEVS
jgi:hypothetical protein